VRWVLAGLLVAPVIELAVAIEVGRWAGALPTLGALVLIAVLGAFIVRRQGAAGWRTLNTSLQAGNTPSRELADRAVLVLAGVLFILPGFVSDALALLLLFPLTRPMARRPLERALNRAAANRVTLLRSFPNSPNSSNGPGGPGSPGRPGRPSPGLFGGGDVVEGEIVDD
jgi:UPF0716 protein FxsA